MVVDAVAVCNVMSCAKVLSGRSSKSAVVKSEYMVFSR